MSENKNMTTMTLDGFREKLEGTLNIADAGMRMEKQKFIIVGFRCPNDYESVSAFLYMADQYRQICGSRELAAVWIGKMNEAYERYAGQNGYNSGLKEIVRKAEKEHKRQNKPAVVDPLLDPNLTADEKVKLSKEKRKQSTHALIVMLVVLWVAISFFAWLALNG